MATELTIFKCDANEDTSFLPFDNYEALEVMLEVRRPVNIKWLFEEALGINNSAIDYVTIPVETYDNILDKLESDEKAIREEIGDMDYEELVALFENTEPCEKLIIAVG